MILANAEVTEYMSQSDFCWMSWKVRTRVEDCDEIDFVYVLWASFLCVNVMEDAIECTGIKRTTADLSENCPTRRRGYDTIVVSSLFSITYILRTLATYTSASNLVLGRGDLKLKVDSRHLDHIHISSGHILVDRIP